MRRKEGEMTGDAFNPDVKTDNRDPRVACMLLLDTSGSMSGQPITELNAGYAALRTGLNEDPLARKRAEIGVVTFGGSARIAVPFSEARDLEGTTFSPGGGTPMGAALDLGLDQVISRKQTYKDAGLEYFRPWLMIITDGAPTDGAAFTQAAARAKEFEAKKGVAIFPIGVQGADMNVLSEISAREPLQLAGLQFVELFLWLSASLGAVSQSKPGASDEEIAGNEAAEQIPLPAPTWAHV